MLSALKEAPRKAVGAKQVLRAIQEGLVKRVYIASDADIFVTRPISLLFLVIAVASVSVFAWKNHKAKVAEKLAKQNKA